MPHPADARSAHRLEDRELAPTSPSWGCCRHLRDAHARVRRAIDHPDFRDDQRALLRATVERALTTGSGRLGDPSSLMFLLASAHGRPDPRAAAHVGAYCLLYILALDLFDDVQDDDLAGKPHADAGPAIAINSAIALTFLAQRELHAALPFLPSPSHRRALLDTANLTGLAAVAGQHRDLLGGAGASTPAEVLAMQRGKTSSVILLAECGALLAGADDTVRAHHRHIGEQLAQLVQIRDDLRDIFAKELSPDLKTGKLTYPIACYLDGASDGERRELHQELDGLPESLSRIRKLLYDRGAVAQAARALEASRRAIHERVARMDVARPGYLRLVLDIVDELSSGIYVVPDLAPTAALRRPGAGAFANRVVDERRRLVERLRPLGLPEDVPALVPWHQPHWMYVPSRHTIFFPDIDDLGDEILPFQAALLGADDLDEPRERLTSQIPIVLAHEMFHFWRDAVGRLTDDHWHEEHAANALSVAYAQTFEPGALAGALELAARTISRAPDHLDEGARQLLVDCERPRPATGGYGMTAAKIAVVTLEMVRRLATTETTLDDRIADLLGPALTAASA